VLGHVADGNFHTIIMIDPDDPEERRMAGGLNDQIVAIALAAGGTCTGEHGVGHGKRGALAEQSGPALAVMRSLKAALDPLNVLNPDKSAWTAAHPRAMKCLLRGLAESQASSLG
jgi:D-lactate dehydrogenase (cytochrome)